MTTPVNRVMLASQAASTNRTKIDHFPAKIGTHGMLMIFNKYTFERPGSRSLLRLPTNSTTAIQESRGGILLPIPNTLVDATGLSISQENMYNVAGSETAAAAAAELRANGILSSLNNLGAGIGSAAMDVYNGLTSGQSPVGTADALFLARRLLGNTLQLGAVSQGIGATINPKASLLFEGVNLKNYNFDWMLAPTEQSESDAIRSIIQKLKLNALPSYNTETIFTRVMFNYPSTVDIYLLGVDTNFYFRFKTAMIRSVNVNYAPNGLSVLRGGKPSAVNLSIDLQEMDIHTSDDYGILDATDFIDNIPASSRTGVNDDGTIQ